MNNFIEINSHGSQALINLNNVTSVTQGYNPCIGSSYWVYLVDNEYYEIDKEQYKTIKAKLIDNNSKE